MFYVTRYEKALRYGVSRTIKGQFSRCRTQQSTRAQTTLTYATRFIWSLLLREFRRKACPVRMPVHAVWRYYQASRHREAALRVPHGLLTNAIILLAWNITLFGVKLKYSLVSASVVCIFRYVCRNRECSNGQEECSVWMRTE